MGFSLSVEDDVWPLFARYCPEKLKKISPRKKKERKEPKEIKKERIPFLRKKGIFYFSKNFYNKN